MYKDFTCFRGVKGSSQSWGLPRKSSESEEKIATNLSSRALCPVFLLNVTSGCDALGTALDRSRKTGSHEIVQEGSVRQEMLQSVYLFLDVEANQNTDN